VKLVFTPEAQEQADECHTWWREHRDVRDLFARELAPAKELLRRSPPIGAIYTMLDGLAVRRLCLPKTRTHVYYAIDTDQGVVMVLAVSLSVLLCVLVALASPTTASGASAVQAEPRFLAAEGVTAARPFAMGLTDEGLTRSPREERGHVEDSARSVEPARRRLAEACRSGDAGALILGRPVRPEEVKVLVSEGRRHLVLAASVSITENDWDIFESLFEFRSQARTQNQGT
jgi:hypothetical protein